MTTETISIKPTWTGLMPAVLRVYRETKDDNIRQELLSELYRLAKIGDSVVSAHEKGTFITIEGVTYKLVEV